MTQALYSNRYSDKILFTQHGDVVEMTGFAEYGIRAGYENDYSEAYSSYLRACKELDEPDYDLLIEDINQNKLRVMTLDEFKKAVHTERWYQNKDLFYYCQLVTSNRNSISMVDPSGGPYIELGTNLKRYYKDDIDRIVDKIEIVAGKVIFKIKQ